jgi:uncharacterized membrane protein YhaH (DUF805 family)
MSKYTTRERCILIIGLIAVIGCVYLKDNFIIPLVLTVYFLFLIWNKFFDKQQPENQDTKSRQSKREKSK